MVNKPVTKDNKPAMIIENTIVDEEEGGQDVQIDETMQDEENSLKQEKNEIEIGIPLKNGIKVFK
jgi:hypothetical protein